MLEALAIKLVSVFAGFLFEQALATGNRIQIDGAPSWYYEEKNPQYLYVFAYRDGGLETLDPLRSDLTGEMEKRIQEIVDVVIYQNFRDVKDPVEQELIRQFSKDDNLSLFVRNHLRMDRIIQEEARDAGFMRQARPARAFGSAILAKKALLDYQTERVNRLQKRISQERARKGFEALDKTFEEDEMDDVARELEALFP
ncbi:DUF4374 domain-containing protein [Desulfobotulus sp. H1]|uniref:DUF4374 domain-containing protein n=1 Tax=Desulfobotulus pelophilus TaxID=2823377 RepID=A0ABT3N7H7_9BACT|nr:hypothetical protein [Desulfobotulus pelophilus]MCW7752987.1 DUF4374 domain-containing protein [Desulfobotulus pelophilus]